MEYNNIETEEQKQKLIEAKRRVEDACNYEDHTLEYVCNMMNLMVLSYKSVHGLVKIVRHPNEKIINIIKVEINGTQYEHVEQLFLNSTAILSGIKRDDIKYYLIKDIGKLLVTIQNFAFIMFEQDWAELSYLIKANINTEMCVECLEKLVRKYEIDYIGDILNGPDTKSCFTYNNEAYLAKRVITFGENAVITLVDDNKLLYLGEDKQGIIELSLPSIIERDVSNYCSNFSKIADEVYGAFSALIDTKNQKIVKVNRGFWESYKHMSEDRQTPADYYNDIKTDEEIAKLERYFVCVNTEYIGVIIDYDVAIYDKFEAKVYWSQGKPDRFLDKDGNVFKGYKTYGSGSTDNYKMLESDYKYEEITKEELLTELKDFKVD